MPNPSVPAEINDEAAVVDPFGSEPIFEDLPADPTAKRGVFRKPKLATVTLAVILTTQLMVTLDGTIVNVALPYIQHSLNFTSTQLSWVVNAYALTFGGLLMFGARCGDLLGRRRTFLAGIAIFTFSSLAGGFAHASWALLGARALQGVGGALAAPATLTFLTSMFPEGRERIRAIGLFTAVSVGGAASGLLAGGLLIHIASWRWVFFVNVPVGIAVLVIGGLVIEETDRLRGKFDLTGALTSTLGAGSIVYGLVQAATNGWGQTTTIASFVAGIVLLTVFVFAERRAEQPILPLRLLSSPSRNVANLGRGLLSAGAYGMFFFLAQYMQDVLHYGPLTTGFGFLPIPLTVFTMSQITTRKLLGRFTAKSLMIFGVALSACGFVLASRLGQNVSYPYLLVSLLLFGAGMGISFVTMTGAALAGVEPRDAAAASGLVNVMQQIGAAVGVALLVTVFGAAAGAHPKNALAFTHGLDDVFRAAVGFLVLAIVLITFVIRAPKQSTGPVPVEATGH